MLDCLDTEIDAATMRLILLRHAKSEKAEPGMRDRDRSLAPRGRKDALKVGAYMVHHGLIPHLAMVSTARRTRETWDQLAPALSPVPPVSYEDGLYNAGPQAIMDLIKACARSISTLLVIGHNPGMHEVALSLIASGDVATRERLNEGLPTAGLIVIDFVGDDWQALHARGGRLDRFVTPRSLRAAAD